MHVFSVCVCVCLCNFASISSKQAQSSRERVSHVVSHFLFPPVYLSPASRLRWNSTIKLAAGIKVKNGPHRFSVETLNLLFLKVWNISPNCSILFICLSATALGMWDPCSSTRNRTHPCTGSIALITGLHRKSQGDYFLWLTIISISHLTFLRYYYIYFL